MDAVERCAGFVNAHFLFRHQQDNLFCKCCISLHQQQCCIKINRQERIEEYKDTDTKTQCIPQSTSIMYFFM